MNDHPAVRFLDRSTPPHIITLVLIAGISALNMSIFLPSLNNMTQFFGTSYGTMQLAVSGYLASTAILQIFIGPLSDRYGRRPLVLWALTIFVIASLGALFATSAGVFLFFRILQAVVATGMVLSRAIVRDMVSQDQAASLIGYVTMGMALIPMIGPSIGGALDQAFGWQASFVVLTGAGIAVLAVCYADLGETVKDGGLSFADQFKSYPDLLSAPRFWGYALCAAFSSGGFFAFLGGAPYVGDVVFGLTPVMTGLAFGAPAIGYAFGNYLSGRLSVRVGINRMAQIGCLIAIAGMGVSLALGLIGISHPAIFFGLCALLGIGNGMTLPNVTSGLLSVRPHLAGTASGLGGTLMIGGGAALSQLAGVILAGKATAVPLQSLMLASVVLSLMAIQYVIRREHRLGIA